MIKIRPEDQAIADEIIKKSGTTTSTIGFVQGAFGDMEDCEGLLEKIITPPEGGTFMKFYGCSYLFKGFPVADFVENLSLAKSLISFLPREIIAKSVLLSSAIVLLFLFAHKRFLYYFNLYFGMIYDRTIVKAGMNEIRYNKPMKEFRRATDVVLREGHVAEKPFEKYSPLEIKDDKDLMFYVLFAKIAQFSYFFLEHDNAYRFRLQDVMGELNKDNIKANVVKEINRLLKILMDREDDLSVKRKWKYLGWMIVPLLYLSPKIRKTIKNLLLELDIDKIKLDEDDWYFCLRRKTYRFRGVSLEERLKEKERIDKEKNHTIVKFIYGKLPPSPTAELVK